ncbi:MAG: cysteine desulfurase NifS [Geobacteraceae bacterium]|nr:cysteine desulfurase NifS [Geobacteraceae bacterium]
MTRHIYLDNNATTALHPEALEAMLPFFSEQFGNPSSIHWAGRRVKSAVEEAREQVASLIGCEASEVVFTSCATESNNMAIKGVAAARHARGNHIVTTTVEHPAVLTPCLYLEHQGFQVTTLDVDEQGMLDLNALEAAITDATILVSAMYANNETGTIFPVREIGELAAGKGICFHCDAVQAVGKIPLHWKESNIHLLSLSGHKLQGPKGIGALIIRKGTKVFPLLHGGSQERNRRAGTENVAGIVGLGKACEIAERSMTTESLRIQALRDRLEQGIIATIPGVRLNGHPLKRLPNTVNLSFLDVKSDSLLFNLDLAGIAASSGSACSSGAIKSSHVLRAMGVGSGAPVANIRFSLGSGNSEQDVADVLKVLPGIVQRLRDTSAVT